MAKWAAGLGNSEIAFPTLGAEPIPTYVACTVGFLDKLSTVSEPAAAHGDIPSARMSRIHGAPPFRGEL